MSFPNIAIIGAGPGGCTLARLLHLGSIPVTIFEGESSPQMRTQGSSLDLHETDGLRAVKEMGLWSKFLKYARFDGEAFVIADKNLKRYVEMEGTTGEADSRGRPEIDRARLREILLESLPEGMVQWGKRVKNIDEDLTLHFSDGSTVGGFDLLVGADGAWSKVRPLVSDVKPFYSGIAGFGMHIPDAASTQPEMHKLVNRGSFMGFSDGKMIGGQQRGDGSVYVYAWGRRDENFSETCGFDMNDLEAVRKFCRKDYADWAPELRLFTQVARGEELEYRNLYMLPVGHSWTHRPRVTLLGDSAHLMTPFAGQGVNIAMEDALNLAQAIIGAKDADETKFDEKIREYEQDIFERAEENAKTTKGNMDDIFFTEEGPAKLVESLAARMQAAQGMELKAPNLSS